MLVCQHRVRYHEADAQGFLFNARYLELADVAMTEFFRALGWSYANLVAGGTDPSVVSATLDFRAPARFDDLLDLTACCTRVGTSSFELAVKVARGADPIAAIRLVYVNVDAETATSRPLPDRVAAALNASVA